MQEVVQVYGQLIKEFPRAGVIGSSFDDYIDDIVPFVGQLPVVTGEMGDTWSVRDIIFFAGSLSCPVTRDRDGQS